MKCYVHHEQNTILDYFNDLGPDDAVSYASDVPFQYSEREGRYTEFIGNPTRIFFAPGQRDHEYLLGQISNGSDMSSNLNNSRQLNITKNGSNLTQTAPVNPTDMSYPTYDALK